LAASPSTGIKATGAGAADMPTAIAEASAKPSSVKPARRGTSAHPAILHPG
jgi:hypothetical protein